MGTTTQPTSTIDLQRFCGYSTSRHYSVEPWVRGGWRYATDGRIVVRVPAPGEPDTPPVGRDLSWPPAAELFAARPMNGPLAPWPEDGIEPGETACEECYETGIVDTVDCECCCRRDCKKCGGRGYTGGRMCPSCNGRGSLDGKGRRVGEHLVSLRLDGLVRSLPNVRYMTGVGRLWPLPFVFDGGEGIVMGMPAAPREAVTP